MLSRLKCIHENLGHRRGLVLRRAFPHRRSSTESTGKSTANATVMEGGDPPTTSQLRRVFMNAAVPMIGFGIMDQVCRSYPCRE